MAGTGVIEVTPEMWEAWKREKEMDKEKYSDESWMEYQTTHHVKRCRCGRPYSFPKTSRDPGMCLACRGEEGTLIY